MPLSRPKIAVVLPAHHAAETRTMPAGHDFAVELLVHNSGHRYGANQKTCYREALRSSADVVVMVHPDYQYDSALLPDLLRPILEGKAEVVLGSRLLGGFPAAQRTPWKNCVSRLLTQLENAIFGLRLAEYQNAYRAFRRDALDHLNLEMNSDDFIFDQQVLAQLVNLNLRIVEVPVAARYIPAATPASFPEGSLYGMSILWLLFTYELHRLGLVRQRSFAGLRRYTAGAHKRDLVTEGKR